MTYLVLLVFTQIAFVTRLVFQQMLEGKGLESPTAFQL